MGPYFSPGLSPNRKSITPIEKLLVFFKFLGGNSRYIDEWFNSGPHESSVCKMVHECLSLNTAHSLRLNPISDIIRLPYRLTSGARGIMLSVCRDVNRK